MPVEIIDLDETKSDEPAQEKKAVQTEGISAADLGLDPCWNLHPVVCKENPKHPLIRERGRFYLERKEELALENMVR